MAIAVKNPEAIEKMRRACRIVALVHKTMEQEIRPGIFFNRLFGPGCGGSDPFGESNALL